MLSFFLVVLGIGFAQNTTVDTLKLREPSGTNSIILKAPNGFANNYSFTLPGTTGVSGQAMVTDGNGTLSYADVLTASGAQTLTNKVLTAPIINNGTLSGSVLSAGTISGGFATNLNLTSLYSSLGTLAGATVSNGTISGASILSSFYSLGTLSGSVLSNGTVSGGTIGNALINAAVVTNSTITNAVVTGGTFSSGTIGVMSFSEQSSSPAAPASGLRRLYPTSSGFVQMDSNGVISSLGAGEATNLLTNASFDSGSTGHSFPAGTTSVDTSDLIDGTQSLRFVASSTSGTIASQILQPTGSFGGVNLESALFVKTTVGSLEVCSMQGFSAVQCTDVPTAGAWTNVIANMAGPSSGSFGYALRTKNNVAVTGTIGIDAAYTGRARNLAQVSQAEVIGTATQPGASNCNFLENTSPGSSFVDLATAGSCASAWTTTGKVTAVGATSHQVTVSNMGPGIYEVIVTGPFTTDTTGVCNFRLSDSTNNFGGLSVFNTANNSGGPLVGTITYTDTATRTFKIQAEDNHAGNCGLSNAAARSIVWSFKRFPTQNEIVARADTSGWYVDANLDGANPDMGTTAISSYTEITDSGLTLKPISGSSPVGVTCSSTNSAATPSTGNTTCSAGSESIGINFVIPKGGTYQVCSYFTHYADVTASSTMSVNFQLIETPTNAQTLTLEGGTRLNSFHGGLGISGKSQTNCSLFNWQSQGIKAVRLMREQTAAGTVNNNLLLADAGSLQGQRDIRFTVFPITNAINAPLFVGSVTSNSTGSERVERIRISSAPAIVRQSGSWVSSITNNGTGDVTLNIPSGIFSDSPSCNVTVQNSGANASNRMCELRSVGATAVRYTCSGDTTPAFYDADIICMGPR